MITPGCPSQWGSEFDRRLLSANRSHTGFRDAREASKPAPDSPRREIGNHVTYADLLKSAGCATALTSKWQLTGEHPTLIHDCGFDEYRMWGKDLVVSEPCVYITRGGGKRTCLQTNVPGCHSRREILE